MKKMDTSGFPLCCGAIILSDFGNTNESMGDTCPISTQTLAKNLERAIKDYNSKAMIIAIVNEQQDRALGPTFLKHGFKPVAVGYTANYGYTLTQYTWVNDPKNPTGRPADYKYPMEGQHEYDPEGGEMDDSDWEEDESCDCTMCRDARGE